ncbi:hypothetical protein JXQ31_10070 [candidate division KSB1 bacterium]|nr:hypothetical protein [candidate division KSB1 bacterium]
MKKIILLTLILLTEFIYINPSTATDSWGVPIMPLKEVKPGMKGIGKTVFYGHEIEEFGFEVLEIVTNFYPQRDIILVRLTGEKAEKNGVVSGMSGSPLYIDGKLIGALAMRFGSFMTEPIGGAMPIQDMLNIEDKESFRDMEIVQNSLILPQYIKSVLCGTDVTFWTNISTTLPLTTSAENQTLQAIRSPLVFSGFDQKNLSMYTDLFDQFGFIVTAGGSKADGKNSGPDIQPGSAVAQVFISGDLGIEATGTVTAVNENKLLAFGHYIFNLGPINLPLSKADILAVLPSMMGSTKMAVSTEIIGAFRQDRLAGLYGDLSAPPKMIPVKVNFESIANEKKEFNFKMTLDRSLNNLIPLYLRIALIQALTSGRLSGSLNSMYMNASISLSDGRTLKFDDFFSTKQQFGFFAPGSDATDASDLVAVILGTLLVNDFSKPDVTEININTKEVAGENVAKVHTIWQDKTEASPGDTLNFSIELKTTNGQIIKLKKSYKVPSNLEANSLTIFISSANSLTNYEIQTNRNKFVPVDFDNILSILEKRRKNNNLYIQIQIRDTGLLLEGEELSALPPSVMNVMNSAGTNGATNKLLNRVLFEESVPTDYVISGAKRIIVRIKQPQQAIIPGIEDEKPQPVYWY